jgi:hypothetical protein
MNIVPTIEKNQSGTYLYTTHTFVEDHVNFALTNINKNGLFRKYTCFNNNDSDFPWYPYQANGGRNYNQEFSIDNQEILKMHLSNSLKQKDKIVIVEIGVNRNPYTETSTSVFLDNKRKDDIYIGIDIEDKTSINNIENNIFTIRCPSENISHIFEEFKKIGITEIDIFMMDGLHSINQVYFEWENYTPLLAEKGIVVMHDTNSHPGPYFLVKSIDTNLYNVYKYLSDVVDWGISVAIKK